MLIKTIIVIILAAFIDVLIKEFYVKKYIRDYKYGGHWHLINDFWKDRIENDHWYRIRYAMILNFIFIIVSGIYSGSIYGSVLYLYLACINTEHILYQWICGVLVPGRKWFDLADFPAWMEGLFWNRWLARYHSKDIVTSEEILTVFIIGTGTLFILYRIINRFNF